MIDIPLHTMKERLTIIKKDGVSYVFDLVRKKYIQLLPEELVRQMLIHYLIEEGRYPLSRMQVEKGVSKNGLYGRYDVIIYDKHVKPWMLIECKSHRVPLSQEVIDQLDGYNQTIGAPYYLISNGINTLCFTKEKEDRQYKQLSDLPTYPT